MKLFFFLLITGLLEIPFAIDFILGGTFLNSLNRMSLALGMHALSSLIWFFYEPKGLGWLYAHRYWSRIFMVMVAFLPVLGWFVVGCIGLEKQFFKKDHSNKNIKEDLFLSSTPLLEKTFSLLPKEERLSREFDLIPLADALQGDDLALKRGAIEKLSKIKTPVAIEELLKYRGDASPEVRFFITVAVARIKEELNEQLQAAKEQVQKDIPNIMYRFFLAKIYVQYIESGLLDEITQVRYQKEALYHLKFICDKLKVWSGPGLEPFLMLLKIYQDQKNFVKSLKVIDQIKTHVNELPSELDQIILVIYYETRQYQKLWELMKTLSAKSTFKPEIQASLQWWGV